MLLRRWVISLEIGTLLFSSVLFPNPSPELSFVVAEIQYGGPKKKRKKKRFFIRNRFFNRGRGGPEVGLF